MKKTLVSLLVLVLTISMAIPSFAIEFSDLPDNHWAHDDIIALVENGSVNGYPDGTYQPDKTITRGEFFKIVMVTVAGGNEKFKMGEGYTGHWATPYVITAMERKYLMDGTGIKNLDDDMTRLEMANVLSKICVQNGFNGSAEKITEYTDISNLDEISQRAIKNISYRGLIGGYPDGSFGPNNTMTRAEIATVVNRLMKLMNTYNTIENEVE